MHDDEVDTDEELVRGLLVRQHPQWADLPIERVPSAGTDNALYRLGDDLAVRLPRIHWAVDHVAKEQTWLPVLAPHLPLPLPLPVGTGEPDDTFPYPWGVVQWLPGATASLDQLDDPVQAALDLAGFVSALRSVEAAGGPKHPRGRPIRRGEELVRAGIERLEGVLDTAALLDVWSRAIAAPDHEGPPVWFHGDLAYLNLLARDGRLSAVIDWGTCAVGDPAIDTIVAWSLFPPEARAAYQDALRIGDAEWARGKGWVITGLFGILSYSETNPVLAADKRRAIDALLADETA
jgi:aminoglycoside phosphotransferase (APT) family kinase protein